MLGLAASLTVTDKDSDLDAAAAQHAVWLAKLPVLHNNGSSIGMSRMAEPRIHTILNIASRYTPDAYLTQARPR